MSIEKNKEELKEQIMKAYALNNEEMEQISGGVAAVPCGNTFIKINKVTLKCINSESCPCPDAYCSLR